MAALKEVTSFWLAEPKLDRTFAKAKHIPPHTLN